HSGIAAGAAAGLVALAVHGLVDFNLHVPSNALLFALLLALRLGFEMHLPGTRRLRIAAAPLALGLAAIALGSSTPAAAPPRPDLAAVRGGATGGMRGRLLDRTLVDHLRRRPADAEAWVLLGWLRAETGHPAEGRALARYGASRDPERRELAAVVAGLEAEAGKP